MPTIEDLRAVLTAREEYAGDPDTVLQHLASPPRRRVLAPTLAAATVAALAVGGVLLAATDDHPQQPSGGGPASTAPPATTTPPGASQTLDWAFSVGPVDGYQFTRFDFSAESQGARITSSGDGSFEGFVTLYSPGVDPKSLQFSADGQHVTVDGSYGLFLPGTEPDTVRAVDQPDSWPRLLWRYRDDAWAEVDGPFGFQSDAHRYDNHAALADEMRIAQALQIGPSTPIKMPFALGHVPSEFVIAAADTGGQDCLGYDLADHPQPVSATVSTLVACRVPSANPDAVPHETGDRIAVHAVGDGTSIVCVLSGAHLDLLDQPGLQAIADNVDASPNPDDPSTWLPVK